MAKENGIVNKIVGIECPTDKVTDRIIEVLEEYGPEGCYQVTSRFDDDYGKNGLKYYRAFSEDGDNPDLLMVVKEGADGYVAKVIDAYTE